MSFSPHNPGARKVAGSLHRLVDDLLSLSCVTLAKQAMQDPSKQRLSCVTVSPSGRYMAIGGDDEIVKVN